MYPDCTKCALTFANRSDFSLHMRNHHSGAKSFPCKNCRLTFIGPDDLNFHMKYEHEDPNSPVDNLSLNLHTHVDLVSPIPQYDGPSDELSRILDPPSHTSTRTANYSLNQQKQTDKIIKDAALNDYDVTVNNNDMNVTIKCSPGFYLQVAKPSLLALQDKTYLSKDRIPITLTKSTKTKDRNGHENTHLLHFSMTSDDDSECTVAVHLHHSTRTIQIQGSRSMPDSSKAALWFHTNVVLRKFSDLARVKQYAVKNTNEAIHQMSRHPSSSSSNTTSTGTNTCNACNSIFRYKAAPSRCDNCGKVFHKKCFKEHKKECTSTPASSDSSITVSSSNPTSSTLTITSMESSPCGSSLSPPSCPPQHRQSDIMSRSSISFVPSTSQSASQISLPVIATCATMSSSISFSNAVSSVSNTSLATNNSLAAPIMTSNTLSINIRPAISSPSSLPPQNSSSNTRKVTRKQKPTKDIPSDHETAIEFLKNELKTAQTRIVQLDFEIKDKDQKISVLLARNKILEEKKNDDLMNKYFPRTNPSSTSSPLGHGLSSESSIPSSQLFHPCPLAARACSPHLVCYDYHHQHPHQQQQSCQHHVIDPKPSDDIATRVDKIEEDLRHIRALIGPWESQDLTPPTEPTPTQITAAVTVEDDDISDDHEVDHHHSIASVEEYIPNVGDFCFDENQLNLNVPTNQF